VAVTLNSNDMETLMQTTLYSPAAARRMWLETNALVIEQGRQILLMSMIVSGGQAFKLPARILPPGCEQVLYDEMLAAGWLHRGSDGGDVQFYPNQEAVFNDKNMHDALLPFADTLKGPLDLVIQGLVAGAAALRPNNAKGATDLVNLAEQLGKFTRCSATKTE
jgi:hypothetical protein